ncbi:MAG: CPBP family intramembrane metalloprotease [Gemmatales bacterium]|nr:CPBP family intramembrane metalloprotease [Gemmatales bacterium]MDW8387373.1 CPBP family intramembrane glutamic endopeptidase [Gemmatales bacterium]
MRYSSHLSLSQAIVLAILLPLCWLADLWGVSLYARSMPHEFCCLIILWKDEVVHVQGFWLELLRLAIFLAPVLLLCLASPRWRTEFGLTLGQRRATFLWTVAATLFSVVVVLIGLLLPIPLDSHMGFTVTDLVLGWQPTLLYTALSEKLWRGSVMAPLIEELGYRAMIVPVMVRLGGRYLALVGSGVIWAMLHWFYQAPLVLLPFYFVSGVFVTWVFLATRSVLPGLVIHSAFNATFEIVMHTRFVA